jgi:hypothetical protein
LVIKSGIRCVQCSAFTPFGQQAQKDTPMSSSEFTLQFATEPVVFITLEIDRARRRSTRLATGDRKRGRGLHRAAQIPPCDGKKPPRIWTGATKDDAIKALDLFITSYGAKWPWATDCWKKDQAELLAFRDVSTEHWAHLRSSNPIESSFATLRLRTHCTKGPPLATGRLAMAFRLVWRKLNKSEKLREVVDEYNSFNGIRKAA